MATFNIETKFDVGDSVFGFVDGEIHHLIIDRVEISSYRFSADNPIQKNEITYLATPTDAKFNHQRKFYNETLFTENELKEYINKYFKNYSD